MRLFILEDNLGRISEMQRVIVGKNWELVAAPVPNAFIAIGILEHCLPHCDMLCLDHDLEPQADQVDPGCGMDVVRWLVAQPIRKPILIHTTNTIAGREMEETLRNAGFTCNWLPPFDGHEWIKTVWPMWIEKLTGGNS